MPSKPKLLRLLPKTCAFCPRKPVDVIDLGADRGVRVCAACAGLRAPRLAPPQKAALSRAEVRRVAAAIRATARKGVL